MGFMRRLSDRSLTLICFVLAVVLVEVGVILWIIFDWQAALGYYVGLILTDLFVLFLKFVYGGDC